MKLNKLIQIREEAVGDLAFDSFFKSSIIEKQKCWQAMFDLAVIVTTTIYSFQEKHRRVFFSPHF